MDPEIMGETTNAQPTKFRFSNASIAKIQINNTRLKLWDTGTKGLCLRVGKKKMFYVAKRKDGKDLYVKLGEFPYTTVEEARTEALKILTEISKGSYKKKGSVSSESTLKWLLEKYVEDRKTSNPPIKESTAKSMIYNIEH